MLFKVMYCLKINLLSLLTSAAGTGDVYKAKRQPSLAGTAVLQHSFI